MAVGTRGSWAAVTKARLVPPTTHAVKVTEDQDRRMKDAERRARVLRKLPHNTTTEMPFHAHARCRYPNTELDETHYENVARDLELIHRDEVDHRRFIIVYSSYQTKKNYQERHLMVGGVTVPPLVGHFHGYIPITPYYISDVDYREILSQYGELRALTFRTMPDRNVRIGGAHFSLDLKQDSKIPNAINVAGDVIHIVDKNARTTCSFCGKTGHLRYQCQGMKRERTLALERRAEEELKEQEKQKEVEVAAPQEEDEREEEDMEEDLTPCPQTHPSPATSEVSPTCSNSQAEQPTPQSQPSSTTIQSQLPSQQQLVPATPKRTLSNTSLRGDPTPQKTPRKSPPSQESSSDEEYEPRTPRAHAEELTPYRKGPSKGRKLMPKSPLAPWPTFLQLRSTLAYRVVNWYMKEYKVKNLETMDLTQLAAHEDLLNNKFSEAMKAYKNTEEFGEYDIIDMENELRSSWVNVAHADSEDTNGWELPWDEPIARYEAARGIRRKEKMKEDVGR